MKIHLYNPKSRRTYCGVNVTPVEIGGSAEADCGTCLTAKQKDQLK